MSAPGNRRILIVDDTLSIHDDYRKILAGSGAASSLAEDEALLFGTRALAAPLAFELQSAHQGVEALEMVRASMMAGQPFAMAFVDMRMPPGWDGVETVERLWQVDPGINIVLCTAYSDHSWVDVLARLDAHGRLLILKKPFDAIEVSQLASALTTKWDMTKQAASQMNRLEEAVERRTRELSDANIIVQNSPVVLYRLRGEPSFPLIYVSHNITKFGHDPARLLGSPRFTRSLIHPDDRTKVDAAMARVLQKDAEGASIEFRMLDGAGDWRWVENRYIPVRDKDGRLIEVEGFIIDITERKVAEEKIALLARTDSLTGLANRATFIERLHQAFAAARRGALPFAVFYLDIDYFKVVNDSLGHPIGDLLLREVAQRLKGCTRESDLVARLGGDEFAVLQGEMGEPTHAGVLAAKLQKTLAAPYRIDGNDLRISASIGICPYAPGIASPDAMLVQADLALYRSKNEGRNQFHFHSTDLDQVVIDRVALADDLKMAIERNEIEVQYQPRFELASRTIVGMEAQLRWNHPVRGLIAPAIFLPIAEKTGTVLALGGWMRDEACRQMRLWRDEGLPVKVIAVNLSLFELKGGEELLRSITETLAKWHLAASDLELDVTEATLTQLTWSRNGILLQLRWLGLQIAIDDFGSEYSSFDYVRAYGVTHLKIAHSFIDRSITDAESAKTLSAIVHFARDVGIGVIAEGVESEQQRAILATGLQTQEQEFGAAVGAARATELLRYGFVRPVALAANIT